MRLNAVIFRCSVVCNRRSAEAISVQVHGVCVCMCDVTLVKNFALFNVLLTLTMD